VLDYKRQKGSKWEYSSRYGGWVIKVQDALNKHFDWMAERQAQQGSETDASQS